MTATIERVWHSVDQVAAITGRHPVTIRTALQVGSLNGYQQTRPGGRWRVHRDDVDAWMRTASAGAA